MYKAIVTLTGIVLILKIRKMGQTQDRFDASLKRLDDVTNGIAANMKALQTQINAGTVSRESLDKLDADIAALEGIGKTTDTTGATPEVPAATEPTDTTGDGTPVATSELGGAIPGNTNGDVIGADGSTVIQGTNG